MVRIIVDAVARLVIGLGRLAVVLGCFISSVLSHPFLFEHDIYHAPIILCSLPSSTPQNQKWMA